MATTADEAFSGEERRRGRFVSAATTRIQQLDLRNTWQVAGGAFFAALGLVIILLAWYGAAHTPYVQQQIPYLVSGSFVGLGLMVLGGLMYWAHWLYRMYDQNDLHHELDAARQQELFAQLIKAVEALDRAPRGAATASVSASVSVPRDAGLVVTATGGNVHRADCSIVARHPEGARPITAAAAKGLKPCRICQPLVS
jgi:hypothetical protein